MTDNTKLAVLVSGRGSNLQAIIDRIQAGKLHAEISVVIADSPQAYALERIKNSSIACHIVERRSYPQKKDFEQALLDILVSYHPDLIILAGFMQVLSHYIINKYPNRIINIHPSLLPAFPGINAQRQALDYGVKYSGCSVHFVNEQVDGGPIILQAVVPVYDNDTEQQLAERILEQEHQLLPKAIALFAEQRLQVKSRKVVIFRERGKNE